MRDIIGIEILAVTLAENDGLRYQGLGVANRDILREEAERLIREANRKGYRGIWPKDRDDDKAEAAG